MSTPLLAFEKEVFIEERAFAKDTLNREQLADKLTNYIDRLRAGAVLAIDAPWGEGKTWFGRNWAKKLKDDGYRVAYIDAFEQDYIGDPFILLASELLSITEERSKTKVQLTKKAANVVKATLSIGTKVGAGLVTKYLLGGVELGDEIESTISDASKEGAAISSEWIEKRFSEYEENKKTIEVFKVELAEFAASQEKPVVIFIDELDRCKPDFAINLIERIKHFFDVPNVVFVLLLNREQLEKAVKGVYGSETDGAAYLGKFVNFFFKLPKPSPRDYNPEQYMKRFVVSTFNKYNFPQDKTNTEIMDLIIFFSLQFDLSLRDIERVIALYAFAYPVPKLNQILIYFIVIKQKFPSKFTQMVKGDKTIHEEFSKRIEVLLNIATETGNTGNNHALEIFKEWHEAYSSEFTIIGEKYKRIHGFMNQWGDTTYEDMLPCFAKQIDLNMEN